MSEMIGEVLAMERFRVRNVIVSVTQRPASESDYIGLIYPGRRGWTYEITAYDKDEEQYMLNIGITAIYKDEEHSDSQCENAYLSCLDYFRSFFILFFHMTYFIPHHMILSMLTHSLLFMLSERRLELTPSRLIPTHMLM